MNGGAWWATVQWFKDSDTTEQLTLSLHCRAETNTTLYNYISIKNNKVNYRHQQN